jgi:hypothetical protein
MNAVLITGTGKTSVRVRDLSAGGASVTSEVPLLLNTDLLFCKGRANVCARIAWVRRNLAGLTFYRDLSPGEADDIFGTARDRQKASPKLQDAVSEKEGAQ